MDSSESEQQTLEDLLIENLRLYLFILTEKLPDFTFPLILPPYQKIQEDVLLEVYEQLVKIGKRPAVNVLLYSYGGDAHSAFHIGRILQEYVTDRLSIFILREAKSAATLLACAGDLLVMSEISELGPMDPQIPTKHGGSARFSPLAIKHTLELIASEGQSGHKEIATALSEKLPEPLLLGEHLKSLQTGKSYLENLLSGRMLKDKQSEARAIANSLVEGYPDHGYCIDYREARRLGLNVVRPPDAISADLFNVMKSYHRVMQHLTRVLNSVDQEEAALSMLTKLQQLASNIIDTQLDRESARRGKTQADSGPPLRIVGPAGAKPRRRVKS